MLRSSTTARAYTHRLAIVRPCKQSAIISKLNLYPDYLSVEAGALYSDPCFGAGEWNGKSTLPPGKALFLDIRFYCQSVHYAPSKIHAVF